MSFLGIRKMQKCKKCKKEKPKKDFRKNPTCKAGVISTCKKCEKKIRSLESKQPPTMKLKGKELLVRGKIHYFRGSVS